jgi:hypothetical protein
MWHREGSYGAIAEQLFSALSHNVFYWNSIRPGRRVRTVAIRIQRQVRGARLVTAKVPELKSVHELKRRIDTASEMSPHAAGTEPAMRVCVRCRGKPDQ